MSPGYDTFDPKIRGDYGYGSIETSSPAWTSSGCCAPPARTRARSCAVGQEASAQDRLDTLRRLQAGESGAIAIAPVCCSYTQKQVILAKDHVPELEAKIFHNDIRSYGKDFERFYQRAARLPASSSSAATYR